MNSFDKDSISRLAVAFLEKDPSLLRFGERALEIIEQKLNSFKLKLVCQEEIETSASLQAALLTAINTGKRCYKGGVDVILKHGVKPLIPWPSSSSLCEIVESIGGKVVDQSDNESYSIIIVLGKTEDKKNWRLLTNDWTCCIVPPEFSSPFLPGNYSFPLGGIFGGSLAIALTFLKLSEFDHSIGTQVIGLSLWRPDLEWSTHEAQGPKPTSFPNKLWLLGLGHLGQAYSWVIGLLPFQNPHEFLAMLQDDDRVVQGNMDSGLLCEMESIGEYKTRVVSKWLELRDINTRIIERKYEEQHYAQAEDPKILLSGLDKLSVRRIIKTNEFKLTIDTGLGAGLNFDTIRVNIFPNNNSSPIKLWEKAIETDTTPILKKLSEKVIGCGYTVGIASSFIGCISACFTISEVIRSYHQGIKLGNFYTTIRELANCEFEVKGRYKTETFIGLTELI